MKNKFLAFIVSNVDTDATPAPIEAIEALRGFDTKSLAKLAALIEAAQLEETIDEPLIF
jgi:hypothetical protein